MGGCSSSTQSTAIQHAPDVAPRSPAYTRLERTHVDGIMDVCALADECDQFASVGEDKQLLLHDWRRGSVVRSWTGHTGTVNRVCYLPSRRLLATASRDLTIRLWRMDSEDASSSSVLRGHELTVSALAPTADATRLASGSRDTSVRLWDVETGAMLYRTARAQNLVTCMAWHPIAPQHVLLQGGEDLRVRVWDTRIGMRELGMDVSADGCYLLTSSKGFNGVGCEARVWDLRKPDGTVLTASDSFTHAQQVREYRGHQQDTAACAFVAGGGDVHGQRGVFVTASKDGSVRVWQRDSEQALSEHTEVGAGAFTAVAMLPESSAPASEDAATHAAGERTMPLFAASAYNASLFVYGIRKDWSLTCMARTPQDDDDGAAPVEQSFAATAVTHGRYKV